MIKIHHLNCGSMCPNYSGNFLPQSMLSCHCLLLETETRLVLVDAGLPSESFIQENRFLYSLAVKNIRSEKDSALAQVKALGFDAKDLTDIIVTHLDFDHIGGIMDFPKATLHMHAKEAQFMNAKNSKMKNRYIEKMWAYQPEVQSYDQFGESWNGFRAVKELKGLPPEILLVPLVGHTPGHSGVAVKSNDQWLLHCGDAFFFQEDLTAKLTKERAASELFQTGNAMDNLSRIGNLLKLSSLQKNTPEVRLINSHDVRYLPTSFSNKA